MQDSYEEFTSNELGIVARSKKEAYYVLTTQGICNQFLIFVLLSFSLKQ